MEETITITLIVLLIILFIKAGNLPFENISTTSGAYCILFGAAAIINGVFNIISAWYNIVIPLNIQEKLSVFKLDLLHISLYILSIAVGIIFLKSKNANNGFELYIAVGIINLVLTLVILFVVPSRISGLLIDSSVIYMIGIVKKYQAFRYYQNKK